MQIYFDIETGPLTDAELEASCPEFEAAANLKDPLKIRLDIESKRLKWKEEAALSALTGKVIAIGFAINDLDVDIIDCADREARALVEFWDILNRNSSARVVGFNIIGFDLPFLFHRSWLHSIPPAWHLRKDRYWNAGVIDIRDTWTFNAYGKSGSLGTIAKFLGLPGKLGDGADFAQLWQTNREAATAYLVRDVEITRAAARRIDPRCAEY